MESQDSSSNVACRCRRDGYSFCGARAFQLTNPTSDYSDWGTLEADQFVVQSLASFENDGSTYYLTVQAYLTEAPSVYSEALLEVATPSCDITGLAFRYPGPQTLYLEED